MPALDDITGRVFASWTVVRFARRDKNSGSMWWSRCACGYEGEVAGKSMKNGASQSCGCIRSPDIAGERFGRLVAIAPAGTFANSIKWRCRCDCGDETTVTYANLKNGCTKSCGCWHLEATTARRLRHGHTAVDERSGTYSSWVAMIGRWEDPKNVGFPRYGGRGISVCPEWRSDFVTFLQDMGERPEGMSIDRIDNDGDYEPDNCRWATRSQQRANQRPARPRTPVDLTGQTFHLLTAVRFDGYRQGGAWWLWSCRCGREKLIRAKSVRQGLTRSCGCMKRGSIPFGG